MFGNKSIACVIPARLDSSRFPRKMLATLKGKPLIQWAYEGATRCPYFDNVIVAVDSKELCSVVEGFGGKAILTDPKCRNGLERLIELKKKNVIKGDIWVNWQGDEPFITSAMIETLLQTCQDDKEEIWTLKYKIEKIEEIESPNVVKVVCDAKGNALYFSRYPIPFGILSKKIFYKHVGIYAYSSTALQKIELLSPCLLEESEKLEQLRFLYHGMEIRVHETDQEIFGIDTEEELLLAEQFHLC